ncbi:MAG: DNA recombination protein RmuC [Chlamydiales bacterium]|nr:DNA recombination protein RmuC [Chlamydiales bacterium]
MIEAIAGFFFVLSVFFAYRSFTLQSNLTKHQIELAQARIRLEEEKKQAQEKMQLIFQAQETMKDSFKALASDTLRSQQTAFFDVAKSTFEKYSTDIRQEWTQKQLVITDVVKPLKESLDKVDNKIQELEKTRISAYASVTETLKNLHTVQNQLHVETNKLSRSLRSSNVRGQWGEMQLKRVVELAGMVEYCDFVTQHTVDGNDGKHRPDLIIKLPNDRVLVIDAKAPLQAYLEAVDAPTDELKTIKYKEHAKHVKKHLSDLSDKAYWESFAQTPEFVVLFLPGESFFGAALEADPQLIEYGAGKRVLMATPTSLIALLRTVAMGWREQVMHEQTQKICELGKSLHERLATICEHFGKLKKAIDGSVDAYNKVVGSFEGRVLTSARRFEEMGISSSQEITVLDPIEKLTRSLATTVSPDEV